MRPRQWSEAGEGWAVAVDVGHDGSVGVTYRDGALSGALRLRDGARAWALARLLAVAVGALEKGRSSKADG